MNKAKCLLSGDRNYGGHVLWRDEGAMLSWDGGQGGRRGVDRDVQRQRGTAPAGAEKGGEAPWKTNKNLSLEVSLPEKYPCSRCVIAIGNNAAFLSFVMNSGV